jgi:hypothetical protein
MTDTLKSETLSFGQQEYPMDASNFKFAIPCFMSMRAKYEMMRDKYKYLASCAEAERIMYNDMIKTLEKYLPDRQQV